MAGNERRYFMALDEAYEYFKLLTTDSPPQPSLYKICAALRTLDKALESSSQSLPFSTALSVDAWSHIRHTLFNVLIASFPGYFVVFPDGEDMPVTAGDDWPAEGRLEFYPERGQRKEDSYHAWLENLDGDILLILRWCFAEGRQYVNPADFIPDGDPGDISEPEEASVFIDRIEQCLQEAQYGKKRAHQKWWQLYWEANSCRNKQQRHELQRQMEQLQAVWGKPS